MLHYRYCNGLLQCTDVFGYTNADITTSRPSDKYRSVQDCSANALELMQSSTETSTNAPVH